MSLSFFPEPFEDELLYSLMARVREMTGLSHYAVINMFLGKSEAWVTVDLPLRLNQVAACIGSEVMSCRDLIERHTLFSYYMGFLDCSAYAHARQLAAEGWTGVGARHIKRRMPSVGRSRYLRFCVNCVNADKKMSGIAGWRRTHQCPGVFVCPEHGAELLESEISSSRAKLLFSPPGDEVTARRVLNPFPTAIATSIASSTAWLLAHPQKAIGTAVLQRRMRLILGDRDWIDRKRDEVAKEDLHQAILKHYGAECIENLGMNPRSPSWIAKTYQAPNISQKHPLHYLLVLDFLGLGSSSLFDAQLDERKSTSERRRKAEASAARQPRAGLELRIGKHRGKVKAFVLATPSASRTDVVAKHGWAVDFLRKHDRKWLDNLLPLTLRAGGTRVDWVQRDQELSAKVRRAADAMLRAPDRPRRATRTRLVHSVDFARLVQCLPRLPTTAQALAASVEDELTFQRRQIQWAAERFLKKGAGSCTRAKLISGSNRKKGLRPELLPEIDELVRQINNGALVE